VRGKHTSIAKKNAIVATTYLKPHYF